MTNKGTTPQHVAVIMDGSGRWAKKRFLPRMAGHKQGLESIRKLVELCIMHKISYLTLFAFSSENWLRPKEEVTFLMDLFLQSLKQEIQKLHEDNICLKVIGDKSLLSLDLQDAIFQAEQLTQCNTKLLLQIAVNYGGRWDITNAAKLLSMDIQKGLIQAEDVNEQIFSGYLSLNTLGVKDVDLLIRTSGEMRISNFLLWNLAYSELFFTNTLWPDFKEADFNEALEFYKKRERRFGGISASIERTVCHA
ncbi:MAG: diphosphate synthase [Francisellaceae bacterium]|nr:diphosphate synthase [Francisellaceae bacterium]